MPVPCLRNGSHAKMAVPTPMAAHMPRATPVHMPMPLRLTLALTLQMLIPKNANGTADAMPFAVNGYPI